MLSLSVLYSSKAEFSDFLQQSGLDRQSGCFVRIYTAVCDKRQAVAIAREIREILPSSALIGATGSGVILNGKQFDSETLVIVESFEHTKVRVSTHTFSGKAAADVAAEIVTAVDTQSSAAITHLLCGDHYYDVSRMVEEINRLSPGLRLTGGVVGDVLTDNTAGFVFTEHGVVKDGIATATLYNSALFVQSEVNIAHEPISPVYTINSCEDSWILEIEHKPATTWCREQFGLDDLREYDDWQGIAENDALIRFPLVLEGHSGASRFIKYDEVAGRISLYFSKLTRGNTDFRISYTSPTKCVQECFDICNRMVNVPVESLFCYSCLFRKLYLGNCAEWELRPFRRHGVCGVFMMGEVGYINGRNEFLNGVCSIVGVAEREHYISPDFSAFEDMYRVRDDNKELHNFVLQKQSAAMSRENQHLLEKLLAQQELAKEQLFTDPNTGMQNTIKFAEDNQLKHFDKMCMVQIENSHLLLSRFGRAGYYKLLRRGIAVAHNHLRAVEHSENYFPYVVNDNTLFLATGPEISEIVFMQMARALYERFQFLKLGSKDDLLINRFVVVLNQNNMLEKGLATLHSSKNLQTHFLICDNSNEGSQSIDSEIEMLHILNQVIENGWVEPYFQGIHDNKTGVIDKYEALMRIHDEDGVVYPPAAFMDIAKRYHLYLPLSRLMITKVLALFGNTSTEVSLNLSVHDINYQPMREFIFRQLDKIGYAGNLVFEILEDENFREMDTLFAFIQEARRYGVRIAIDDFGSGYSSFMEIARMEPEFIKIDSSIIRNIASSAVSRKVLTNIVFLGRQLDAKLIAEFVENIEIQMSLSALDIDYSQGYYFAKPMPYSELGLTETIKTGQNRL